MRKKRLLIGMSGASGAPLTLELLRQLQKYRTIVQVGIHYDNITKEQILEIVRVAEELRKEVI